VQGIRLSAGETQSGSCRVDVNLGGICDFTDLPAFTRVSVTVTYLALQGSWSLDPVVSVSAAGDVVSSNNAVTAHVETLAATDLELRVDGSLGGRSDGFTQFPADFGGQLAPRKRSARGSTLRCHRRSAW
jgi:hypothetical protein